MQTDWRSQPRMPWQLVLLLLASAFLVGATGGAISLFGFGPEAQSLALISAIMISTTAICAKG